MTQPEETMTQKPSTKFSRKYVNSRDLIKQAFQGSVRKEEEKRIRKKRGAMGQKNFSNCFQQNVLFG